jgi:hypothetical protein
MMFIILEFHKDIRSVTKEISFVTVHDRIIAVIVVGETTDQLIGVAAIVGDKVPGPTYIIFDPLTYASRTHHLHARFVFIPTTCSARRRQSLRLGPRFLRKHAPGRTSRQILETRKSPDRFMVQTRRFQAMGQLVQPHLIYFVQTVPQHFMNLVVDFSSFYFFIP